MGAEPYVGEISMFGGTFAPRGWAFCDGQLLAIAQNDALFSLLGTTYGGDGRTTFALPDLRGRAPVHAGNGPGLTPRVLGEKFGAETVTLTTDEIPVHHHECSVSDADGDSSRPSGRYLGRAQIYTSTSTTKVTLADDTVSTVGGGQSHANVQPSSCINYIIALVGIYPSRN
jgi:microcystin-dependent protein